MLDRIIAYAEKQGLTAEPGFTRKKVSWVIQCDGAGRFIGILPLLNGKRPRSFDRCPDLSQGELVAGSTPRSQFLIESLQTVALYAKEGEAEDKLQRAESKHRYFVSLLKEAATALPELKSAAKMLSDASQLEAIRHDLAVVTPKPKPTDAATVWIDLFNPLETDCWHDWWCRFRQTLHDQNSRGGNAKAETMRGFLSGENIEPAATHDKIKGLAGVGGLGTGDVVIGFDKEAFQSFGLKKSTNAAISEENAKLYSETLNRLIAEHSQKLGNALVLFWYSHSVVREEDLFPFLSDPETPEAGVETLPRKLLRAIERGDRPDLGDNHYYALTLSGASGRVMVRRWIEGKFEELAQNVDDWFSHLQIVARDGGLSRTAKPPKFLAVAGSIERDLGDVPSPLMTRLWESAVTGGNIPHTAHAKALLRCRVDIVEDNPANHARMGLLKAYHTRNRGDTEMKPYLNPDHPSPAYQSGRLMAILASLQRAALGDVGAGVVQRYYTAASQTPALTLGRLIANAKNHLAKLEGGLQFWYENRIAEVMGRIRDRIPRTLDLEQQSLFALGYYQQLAALRTGSGNKETGTEATTKE